MQQPHRDWSRYAALCTQKRLGLSRRPIIGRCLACVPGFRGISSLAALPCGIPRPGTPARPLPIDLSTGKALRAATQKKNGAEHE